MGIPMQKVDKTLLKKYFEGTCSAPEKALVRKFLTTPESSALLAAFLEEQQALDYGNFMQEHTPATDHVEQWRKKIHTAIEQKSGSTANHRFSGLSVRAAAILVIVLGLLGSGIYFAFYSGEKKEAQLVFHEAVNPRGQRATILLADSTTVFLGPASKLTYPAAFPSGTREVFLEGEAFFEVKHNPRQSFIVHTGTVQTRVLGTSFKVNAFTDVPLSVAVATGTVEIQSDSSMPGTFLRILQAGEQLTYIPGQPMQVTAADPDATESWKNARLVFNAQTMAEIFRELERWHKTDIRIEKKHLAEERLTVAITATMPLRQIMNILAAAGKFRYEIKTDYVKIY